MILAIAISLTAAGAFYVEEDWRAERAWRRVAAEYAARHEPLSIEALAGKPIPDAQNLFKAPIWADLVSDRTPQPIREKARAAFALDRLEHVAASASLPTNLAEAKRRMTNAGLLAKDDRRPVTEALLAGLQPAAPLLDGLRTAVRERQLGAPGLSMPPTILSELSMDNIYSIGRLLGFRAQIDLAAGRPDGAFEDTCTQLRIARACQLDQAYLMPILVGLATVRNAEVTISAAIARHTWSADQIATLQSILGELRFADALGRGVRLDRAWGIAYLDNLAEISPKERSRYQIPRLVPPGSVARAKITLCTMSEEVIDISRQFGTSAFRPRLTQFIAAEDRLKTSAKHADFFARAMYQKVGSILRDAALDIDSSDALITALALERYYLGHRRYPDTLAELVSSNLGARTTLSDGSTMGYSAIDSGSSFELRLTPATNGVPRK